MPKTGASEEYRKRVEAESRKWGEHLKVEATGEWHAWLDHPVVLTNYTERSRIDGLTWDQWVVRTLGGPARRSLDLGCGSGGRSLLLHRQGATSHIEGIDVSEDRIAEGERWRKGAGIPGGLRVEDINACSLPERTYDLIFSAHSYHHFLELEHVNEQVHRALTDDGLFVLEEFVGPTQFQWTDTQINITRELMAMLPEDLKMLRWGAVKPYEGRPTVDEVVAASPFESIRSAEIVPLFEKYFDVVHVRNLGGTIQHLLYNGIVHNFQPTRPGAFEYANAICQVENALVDSGMLPSDFMLLVGRRKKQR